MLAPSAQPLIGGQENPVFYAATTESQGLGHTACRAQVSCQQLTPATCLADVSRGHATRSEASPLIGSALLSLLSDPSACHVLCPCTVGSDYTPRAILW